MKALLGQEEGLKALKEAGIPYLTLKGPGEALHPPPENAFYLGLKKALEPTGRFPGRPSPG
jgi:glycolate oxidase FAD binding subunit